MIRYLKKILLPSFILIAGYSHAQTPEDSTGIRKLLLKEVQIQAYRLSKYPAGSFYQSSSLSNTEDILSRIEGVSLVRRGPVGMEPVLRAFSGGQLNVVIDGMKIFGACTDNMDPVTIYAEPVNLKSIDVKHAGEGMEMGSTVGGTLNMKLADALITPAEKISGSASAGYYSAANAVQNALALNYSTGKWALRLSGVYRNYDNYRNGAGEKVNFSQYEKANISLSAKYLPGKNRILKVDFLADDGWNIGYPALPMDVGYARARIGGLTFKQHQPERFITHIEAKIYANSIHHAMDDTHRPAVPIHMDMPGQSHTQGVFAEIGTGRIKNHSLSFKADIYHNAVKADMTMYPENGAPMYMLTWPENHQTVAGLYIHDKFTPDEKNSFQLKVRMDAAFSMIPGKMGQNQFEGFGFDVSKTDRRLLKNINLGYSRYLNKHFTLYASAGYGERLPTTSERYGIYLYNRMDNHDYIGNPSLKNETALSGELNLIYSGNNFYWKLSGFANSIAEYITGITQPGLSVMTAGAAGVRSYKNIPSAFISGAESSLNYTFANRQFTLNHTLKYVRGENGQGESLPLMAPLKSLSSLRFEYRRLFIQAENEFSLRQRNFNSEFGETETPGYTILNFRSRYTFAGKNHTVSLSGGIDNLLDKAYYEHLDWGKLLRPGRNVYVLVSVNF